MEHAYDGAIDSVGQELPDNVIEFPTDSDPEEPADIFREKFPEIYEILDAQRELAESTGDELRGMFERKEDLFNDSTMEDWRAGRSSNRDMEHELYQLCMVLDEVWQHWTYHLENLDEVDDSDQDFNINENRFNQVKNEICSPRSARLMDRYLFTARQNLMKLNSLLQR
jgi:hypothetical protein